MKELTKELTEEIVEYYKQYLIVMQEKKDLTDHNRDMKNNFMETHFDEEVDPADLKQIKKEITKYFNSIEEVGSGSDPVLEVKDLRKNHLDLEYDVYDDLMKIFKQISENNGKKEALDEKLEKEVLIKLVVSLGSHIDVIKGVLKTWKDTEEGKFPVILTVADDYRKIITEVGKLED